MYLKYRCFFKVISNSIILVYSCGNCKECSKFSQNNYALCQGFCSLHIIQKATFLRVKKICLSQCIANSYTINSFNYTILCCEKDFCKKLFSSPKNSFLIDDTMNILHENPIIFILVLIFFLFLITIAYAIYEFSKIKNSNLSFIQILKIL